MKIEEAIKQTAFQSLSQKVTVNLMYTASYLNNLQTRFFKPFSITPQQYNVLRILRGQKGKPSSLNLVQERMLDKASNASRLVDKLVDKKFVERKMCPNDRRQVELLITENGNALLTQIDKEMSASEIFASQLSDQEKEQLSLLLDKCRNH